ncbi:HAMP domain-containing histidine kinase [bacterium SCSIO 12827]|nr:HAMP domain-containing histidine kinase [bacterium SCSIO 12827]
MLSTTHAPPQDSAHVIEVLKAVATPLTGEAFLHNLVQQLGVLFQAETTFVAHRVDPQSTKVRGLAAWKDGARKEAWEFDLQNNPCHMVYRGEPIFLPCDVAAEFSGKKDSGYESFVGYPLRGRNGDVMGHIAVYSSKILTGHDDWVSLCGLFADRAEAELQRQLLENERDRTIVKLKALDALKNEFISIAAHDLRSPLGAVRGMAEVLSRQQNQGEREQALLKNIIDASDRMVGLVNRYLDYASIEAGALKLNKIETDLSRFLEGLLVLRRVLATDKEITIQADLPDRMTCSVDSERLGQVIDNLLDNAIKFSPHGGTIKLGLSEADDGTSAVISVSDEGTGIPEDFKSRIFGAFETAADDDDSNRFRSGKSFGLGLMISKRVVDAHGGSISVDENAEGGAILTVTLPKI